MRHSLFAPSSLIIACAGLIWLFPACSEKSPVPQVLASADLSLDRDRIGKVVSGDLVVSAAPAEGFGIPRRILSGSPVPLVWPYDDVEITSPYGFRLHPVLKTVKYHRGLDFARALGTEVYAIGEGRVVKCVFHAAFGNMVEVDHGNGLISQYAHLSEILVTPDDLVMPGTLIGLTGSTGRSTGAHLHLGIIAGGHSVDPFYFLARSWSRQELAVNRIPWVFGWKKKAPAPGAGFPTKAHRR